jgi:hypothetical protein
MASPDTERELFESALTDQPMDDVAATAEVEVTTTEAKSDQDADGRKRDDKGRFVASEQQDQPVVEQTPAQTQDQPVQAQVTQPEQRERGEIPAWRLKEEADAKREWQARAEQAQREAEEIRRQNAAFQQQLADFQRQMQNNNNPPPDMYSDPEGYQRHQVSQHQQALREQAVMFSEQLARVKFGDELYGKAEQEISRYVQMNPHDPIVHVIRNSSQPAFELVKWYQQQEANKRLAGKSIDDLLKEEREKALSDPAFLAQAIEKAKATAKPVQTQANPTIPSLNRTTAAASAHADEDESDAGLLRAALRR